MPRGVWAKPPPEGFTPEEWRVEARRRAATAMHAKYPDGSVTTAAARTAFLGRFRDFEARSAYFRGIARKSAVVRRERANAMRVDRGLPPLA